jgi:hypothetical protein
MLPTTTTTTTTMHERCAPSPDSTLILTELQFLTGRHTEDASNNHTLRQQ